MSARFGASATGLDVIKFIGTATSKTVQYQTFGQIVILADKTNPKQRYFVYTRYAYNLRYGYSGTEPPQTSAIMRNYMGWP